MDIISTANEEVDEILVKYSEILASYVLDEITKPIYNREISTCIIKLLNIILSLDKLEVDEKTRAVRKQLISKIERIMYVIDKHSPYSK